VTILNSSNLFLDHMLLVTVPYGHKPNKTNSPMLVVIVLFLCSLH